MEKTREEMLAIIRKVIGNKRFIFSDTYAKKAGYPKVGNDREICAITQQNVFFTSKVLIRYYYDEETDCMLAELKEQRINALHEAVSTLMPEDQMLLHLYYAEDLPLKEISEIVGHDHFYLATRLQRIRKKLCAIIKGIER